MKISAKQIENWTSKQGDREDHYFLSADKKIYLFGINPKIVSRKTIKKVLDLILSDEKLAKKST